MTTDQRLQILTATMESLKQPTGAYSRDVVEYRGNVIDHTAKLADLALQAMEDDYHPEPCAEDECWVCEILNAPAIR
jgi:hypothetical protein